MRRSGHCAVPRGEGGALEDGGQKQRLEKQRVQAWEEEGAEQRQFKTQAHQVSGVALT